MSFSFKPETSKTPLIASKGANPGSFGFEPTVEPVINFNAFSPLTTLLQITTKEAASAEIAVFAWEIEPNNLGARPQSFKLKFLAYGSKEKFSGPILTISSLRDFFESKAFA